VANDRRSGPPARGCQAAMRRVLPGEEGV
jgi:hypothetical protein